MSRKRVTKGSLNDQDGEDGLAPLPKGWCWAKIHEVGEVKLGRQRSPEHHHGLHMRPYLRVANVFEDRIDLTDVKEMNFTPEEFETFKLQHGDILLNEGQSLELVGRPAMYRDELPGSCFQNTLVRFRPGPFLLPAYALLIFRYYLHSQRFQRIAKRTVNIAHLSSSRFAELDLPVPPPEEQRRIVVSADEIFSDLDAGVAALKRVLSKLRRYRASALREAVQGRLTADWRAEHPDVEPATDLIRRIIDDRRRRWEEAQLPKFAEAGKEPPQNWREKYEAPEGPDTSSLVPLPPGWCWARVDQVGDVQLGRQRSPQHHNGPHMRPYLRVANVFEDRIDTSDVLEMNFTPQEFVVYQLTHGDILLNEGQSLHLVGRPAMYRGEVPGACFQNTLVRFRAYDGVLPEYALLVFLAYLHNKRFQQIARWTVNIAHLGAERFSKLEFPLPPEDEQKAIIREVEERLSVVHKVVEQVAADERRAARLRQAILKRAFEGRLVPQDPDDEPAERLLERIRRERDGRPGGDERPVRGRRGRRRDDSTPLLKEEGPDPHER